MLATAVNLRVKVVAVSYANGTIRVYRYPCQNAQVGLVRDVCVYSVVDHQFYGIVKCVVFIEHYSLFLISFSLRTVC